MSVTVYRVQDAEGRGPFRPGVSRFWFEGRNDYPKSFLEWFGNPRPHYRPGEIGGCGCRSLQQLAQWFRPNEIETLGLMGYRVVRLEVDRVIGENEHEVIFARRKPLRFGCEPVAFNP